MAAAVAPAQAGYRRVCVCVLVGRHCVCLHVFILPVLPGPFLRPLLKLLGQQHCCPLSPPAHAWCSCGCVGTYVVCCARLCTWQLRAHVCLLSPLLLDMQQLARTSQPAWPVIVRTRVHSASP